MKRNIALLQQKFFLLLIALLLFNLLLPLIVETRVDMYIFGILLAIILFFSVYSMKHSRRLISLAIFLAAMIFLGFWTLKYFPDHHLLEVIESILATLFFILITITVLRYVIQDSNITFNTLCGAICGYLLIGFSWAFIYVCISLSETHAFHFPAAAVGNYETNVQKYIYYSYVTLTTLGYGDITPISKVAKTMAWLEAIIGQIYLTVWIAQLVGLHISQKYNQKDESNI